MKFGLFQNPIAFFDGNSPSMHSNSWALSMMHKTGLTHLSFGTPWALRFEHNNRRISMYYKAKEIEKKQKIKKKKNFVVGITTKIWNYEK